MQQLRSSRDDKLNRPLRSASLSPDTAPLIYQLLHAKQGPLAVMICGPKGTGKSTLARHLLNGALSRGSNHAENAMTMTKGVLLLDLDPGQPEFAPPGTLSLVHLRSYKFGPSFTHPAIDGNNGDTILRMHHFGMLSPSTDPGHYLECASDLIDHYRKNFSGPRMCPLVINCCGWVQGTGLELLVELIRYRFLTDIIYTITSGPREVVSTLQAAAQLQNIPLHVVCPKEPQVNPTPSGNTRTMQSLSYFHLDDADDGNLRWNAEPLSHRPPLIVHYAGPQQSMLGVMVLGEKLDPELFFSILEGCVVGLVVLEHDSDLSLLGDCDDSPEDGASDAYESVSPSHSLSQIVTASFTELS